MWSTRIISDDGLTCGEGGIELDIRLPWYRSLPLSVIHDISLLIDGQEIPSDTMTLSVNDQEFQLSELEGSNEIWWHILDSGILKVHGFSVENGSSHTVSATVTFEIPYVPGAIIPSTCVKTLTAN